MKYHELLICALLFTLGACEMLNSLLNPPVTIEQRIEKFAADINTGLSLAGTKLL